MKAKIIQDDGKQWIRCGDKWFRRTAVGSYYGDPTPEEIDAIERDLEGDDFTCVVRRCNVGDLAGGLTDGFELHFFDL